MIRVDFACNDPDNGNFAGRVTSVDWRGDKDTGLDLVFCSPGAGLKFTDDGTRVRVLRRWYPYEKSQSWVGNWCWDAFWFEPPIAKAMLRHFRESGKFSCEGGPTVLFDWWEACRVV